MNKFKELIAKHSGTKNIVKEETLVKIESKDNIPEKMDLSKAKLKIHRSLFSSQAEREVFQYLQEYINTDNFYVVPHILVSEVIKDFAKYDCFEDTYKKYCEFIKEEPMQTHFELMHFDFVIYNKKDFAAVLILEVDGLHHKTKQTTKHFDMFKEFIANQFASIPFVRLDVSVKNVDIKTELKKVLTDKNLNDPFNYPIYCWKCGRRYVYQPNKNQPNSSFFYCTSCKKEGTEKNVTLSYNEKICPPIFVWDK